MEAKTALALFMVQHRRIRAGGRYWYCTCGEEVPTNSNQALANHQADKILDFFLGE